MNRYTQLSTTQFAPRSIEELAIVPAAFRQKHDATAAQMEQMRSQLNMSVDPSQQHSAYARSLVDGMNGQINKMSENLASNGYNNLTGLNVIKMNRDYQSLVGPNGELGRINAAKKDMAEKYKTFREEGIKAGHDGDVVDKQWASHVQKYYGFDDKGQVANIESLGAPKRYEVVDALKDWKPLLGEIQRRVDQAGGGSIFVRPDGSLQTTNKSGSIQRITNIPQLQQLQELIQSEFLIPGGKGFKSAQFQGKNMVDIFNEINSSIQAITVDKVNDTTNYSTSVQGYKNPNEGDGGAGGGAGANNLLAVGPTFNTGSLSGISSLSDAKSRLNQLNKESNLSGAAMQEKRQLMNQIQGYENRLKGDKEYQTAKKEYDDYAKKIGASKYGEKQSLADVKKSAYLKNEDDPKLMGYMTGLAIKSQDGNSDKKLQELRSKMQNIEKKSFTIDNFQSEGYVLAETGNTKADKAMKAMNNSIGPVLKSSNFALGNNFDLLEVAANGVTRSGKQLDREDKERIQTLISNMSDSDMKAVRYNHRGASGLPEYTIQLSTKKGQKATLDRFWRGEKGDMDDIGDGGNITITVNANTLNNSEGVKTFNSHASEYFRSMGGPKGNEIANSIERNVYKNSVANDVMTAGVKWGEVDNNPAFFNYTDPTTGRTVVNEGLRQIVGEQAVNGIKNQTGMKDEQWNRLPDSDKNKMIESYIKSNKNQELIIF